MALSRAMGIERHKCENPYNRTKLAQLPLARLVKSAKKEQPFFLFRLSCFIYFEIKRQAGIVMEQYILDLSKFDIVSCRESMEKSRFFAF